MQTNLANNLSTTQLLGCEQQRNRPQIRVETKLQVKLFCDAHELELILIATLMRHITDYLDTGELENDSKLQLLPQQAQPREHR